MISSDTNKRFYHVQPAFDGVGVVGNISPLLTYPGEFSHCKDMSFAEDHLLVAFSKEIGDPSFGILISKPDGQNKKVICLNPTPITSVSFCWGKVIFCCQNDHQVKCVYSKPGWE